MASTGKTARRRWLIAAAALAALAGLAVGATVEFGRWLIVSDPLRSARAIVVLAGETPYRAEEAAKLYHQGWAHEIWLTPEPENPELARLGINAPDRLVFNREALVKLGVAAAAIRVMPTATHNTEEEERQLLSELKRLGGDCLILVTSPYHTRRVRIIWHKLADNSPQAVVRPALEEPFDAAHWWRNPDDLKYAGHEFFGLLNAWAGDPVRRRGAE